jgi:hypothetical protein
MDVLVAVVATPPMYTSEAEALLEFEVHIEVVIEVVAVMFHR